MAEPIALSDDFLRQLMPVGVVDLLVAIPTHNDAKIIGDVVQAVRVGLIKSFPRDRAVLVITDGGSRDGTLQHARAAAAAALPADAAIHSLRTLHTVSTTCGDGVGAPAALPLVMTAGDLLQARACAVISPSPNVTPDWVDRLLRPPVQENVAFVAPLYRRHKFDGLLINLLLYPMTRAIYGKRIREPYATDYAFSGELGAELVAGREALDSDGREMADELWLSTSALVRGYKVCEVFLGPKSPSHIKSDLVPVMQRTVGTLFRLLDLNADHWRAIRASEPLPVIGGTNEITTEPLRVNRKRLYDMFHSGITDLQQVLSAILRPNTLADLSSCAGRGEEQFCFPDELWARVVYEFAVSYHKSVITRDHIIQALVPVYRGKTFEFLTRNRQATADETEHHLESICAAFETLKPYLVQLWDEQEGVSYEGNDPPRSEPDLERAGERVRASGAAADRDADRDRRGLAGRVRMPRGGARHPAYHPV